MYTLRLSDAVRDRTFDEVWDLVMWLPRGSAFRSAFAAGNSLDRARELFGWTTQDEIGLALVNLAQEQSWILAQSHSTTKIPRPKPIPGPGSPTGKPDRKYDATAMARSLLSQQA